MSYYPIIETVGIEFETVRIPQEKNINIPDFAGIHDSSIESDIYKRENVYFSCESEKVRRTIKKMTTRIGQEFVMAPIYNREILKERIYKLTDRLSSLGESERGERESIHVHIGMPYNLDILKNNIILAGIVENFMFHLGGMGYAYRGLKNESIFSRPFSSYGPPIVIHRGRKTRILTEKKLLNSSTIDEFWGNYGGLHTNYNNKYHPARYFFINLYSLLLHGTLEYRVFNKTLNPYRILAIIELCRGLASISLDNDKVNRLASLASKASIFDYIEVEENHKLLDSLPIDIDDGSKTELHTILDLTPRFVLPKYFVYTHLRNYLERGERIFWEGIKPSYIDDDIAVITPKVIDIHFLRNEIPFRPDEEIPVENDEEIPVENNETF